MTPTNHDGQSRLSALAAISCSNFKDVEVNNRMVSATKPMGC